MEEKTIEGKVIFYGEFRNGETKQFEVEVMGESGEVENIRCSIDPKFKTGNRVEITYAENPEKENYGLKFIELSNKDPTYIAKILRSGYLR